MRRERTFEKSVHSLEKVFDFLEGFIADNGLGSDMEFCLNFVVEEIFVNMVRHNRGSTNDIRVVVERNGDRVQVELTDFDVDPFDPEGVDEVDVEAAIEDRRAGGLGLHLVKSMADKLTYEYEDRELRVTIYKDVS